MRKFILSIMFSVIPTKCFAKFSDGDMLQGVGATLLIWAFFSLIAFLILREVFCWYLKINQRIGSQNEIKDLLSKIARSNDELIDLLRAATPAYATVEVASSSTLQEQIESRKKSASGLRDRHVCPKCYRDYSKYVLTCEDCEIDLAKPSELP